MVPSQNRRGFFKATTTIISSAGFGLQALIDNFAAITEPQLLSALSMEELITLNRTADAIADEGFMMRHALVEWQRGGDTEQYLNNYYKYTPAAIDRIRKKSDWALFTKEKDPEDFDAIAEHLSKVDDEAQIAIKTKIAVMEELRKREPSYRDFKKFTARLDLTFKRALRPDFNPDTVLPGEVQKYIAHEIKCLKVNLKNQKNKLPQIFALFRKHFLNGTLEEWSEQDVGTKESYESLKYSEKKAIKGAGSKYKQKRTPEQMNERDIKKSQKDFQTLLDNDYYYHTSRKTYGERVGLDEYVVQIRAPRELLTREVEEFESKVKHAAPKANIYVMGEIDKDDENYAQLYFSIRPNNFALREMLENACRESNSLKI